MSKIEDTMKALTLHADGPDLIKQAIEKRNHQLSEKVVSFVTGTMNQIEVLTKTLSDTETYLEFQRNRLKAIHNGKFQISNTGQIIFDDVMLNG
jgi:hypothetical protein